MTEGARTNVEGPAGEESATGINYAIRQRILPNLLQAPKGETRRLLPNLGLPEALKATECLHTSHA